MSSYPEQLNQLRKISELFEQGKANQEHLRQLSNLLSRINRHQKGGDLHQVKKS